MKHICNEFLTAAITCWDMLLLLTEDAAENKAWMTLQATAIKLLYLEKIYILTS